MAEQETPEDVTRARRYRMFMAAESVLLVSTILACGGMLHWRVHAPWIAWFLSALWVWHIMAIPICFLYLIGKPIVMTLVPLVDSAESRAFRKELRQRAVLSDA
jgi:hypothetical protein